MKKPKRYTGAGFYELFVFRGDEMERFFPWYGDERFVTAFDKAVKRRGGFEYELEFCSVGIKTFTEGDAKILRGSLADVGMTNFNAMVLA